MGVLSNIKDKLASGKKGEQCVQNEDGTVTCRRIKKDNNEIVSDGSEFTFGLDAQTCKPIFQGEQRIMDGDQEWAKDKIKSQVEACRRGFV